MNMFQWKVINAFLALFGILSEINFKKVMLIHVCISLSMYSQVSMNN